jgi:hypothetical protein
MKIGRVILWILFWPIMLPYWLFKTKRPVLGALSILAFIILAIIAPKDDASVSSPSGPVTSPARTMQTPPAPPTEAPSLEYIRAQMREMTEAQRNEYSRGLVGNSVHWTGRVVEVNEKTFGGYEVWIDMDPPGALSVQDVEFDVSKELGLSLSKEQRVSFTGEIKSAGLLLNSCQIGLKNARIL